MDDWVRKGRVEGEMMELKYQVTVLSGER